jgi:hypothetical protein
MQIEFAEKACMPVVCDYLSAGLYEWGAMPPDSTNGRVWAYYLGQSGGKLLVITLIVLVSCKYTPWSVWRQTFTWANLEASCQVYCWSTANKKRVE